MSASMFPPVFPFRVSDLSNRLTLRLSFFFSNLASRVGHLRFTFNPSPASPSYANSSGPRAEPYITLQSSRATYLVHGDKPEDRVPYFPKGFVEIDVEKQEVRGWNDERQE